MVAEHKSNKTLTATTTALLPKTVGEHYTGKMETLIKAVLVVTRLSCYRRGNQDAVTHPRVATTGVLFFVEAGSLVCHEDFQNHQV